MSIADHGLAVLCYDLIGDSIRFLVETAVVGACAISPDGSELWFSEFAIAPIGSMRICDARTGAVISQFATEEFGRWPASNIAFCEEFGKVYLRSSKGAPILVVDAASHAIVGKIAHNPGRPYESIVTMKTSY